MDEAEVEILKAGVTIGQGREFMTNHKAPNTEQVKKQYEKVSGQDAATKELLKKHRIDG